MRLCALYIITDKGLKREGPLGNSHRVFPKKENEKNESVERNEIVYTSDMMLGETERERRTDKIKYVKEKKNLV